MNEIADTRYKDIHHIDVQANENKVNYTKKKIKFVDLFVGVFLGGKSLIFLFS